MQCGPSLRTYPYMWEQQQQSLLHCISYDRRRRDTQPDSKTQIRTHKHEHVRKVATWCLSPKVARRDAVRRESVGTRRLTLGWQAGLAGRYLSAYGPGGWRCGESFDRRAGLTCRQAHPLPSKSILFAVITLTAEFNLVVQYTQAVQYTSLTAATEQDPIIMPWMVRTVGTSSGKTTT